jgi:NapC/NirT cytochrome c family, N-terminal region
MLSGNVNSLQITLNVSLEWGIYVRWLKWMAVLLAFGFVSFVASMEVTDYLEQDNRFCIACHLHEQILSNFLTETPQLVTLAGAHHQGEVKCIDCHIGATFNDKLIVKAIAGWDTIQYFIGNFEEPDHLRFPLGDRTCLKCHTDGGQSEARADAFHNDPNHRNMPFECVACHQSHPKRDASTLFLEQTIVHPVCQECHREDSGEG